MRILIDAMGGDNAPGEIVKGALLAAVEFGVDVTLIGQKEAVRNCLMAEGAAIDGEHIALVNTSEVITMEDDPATATRRKKDSSMAVMLSMLSRGEGDACISAGSTGALLSGATLTVKRIRGIRRACFAPVIPNGGRGMVLADCGANAECTPEYLLQFAYMGSFYAREMLGCGTPRVALLNIGAEESKGTALQKETFALLRAADEAGRIRFVGNLEPSQIFKDQAEVLVCDGFSGNVLLKTVEGSAMFLMKNFKGVLTKSLKNKLAALTIRRDMTEIKKLLDAGEVGGTALLGLSRPVIKAHGASDARAVRGAVRQAVAFTESRIVESIQENIEYMRLANRQSDSE